MSISVLISVVLGVLFVAALWMAASGYFETGINQATELTQGLI